MQRRRTNVPVAFVCLAAFVTGLSTACGSEDKPAPNPPPTDSGPPPGWRAVVGAGGTVAQTFDDSRWETRVFGDTDLLAVTCVGNLEGWAAGRRGRVARTHDGGRTWTLQASGTIRDLRGIRMGDLGHGLFVGDGPTLAITQDGGANWRTLSVATTATLRGAATAWGRRLFVAVGDAGTVLRSTDAGLTWSTVHVDGAGDLQAVAADHAGHWVLSVDASGAVFASSDGAESFVRETVATRPLRGVSIDEDGQRALVVGDAGVAMLRTAPRTYRGVDTGTTVDLRAALVSSTRLYAAGDSGTLLGGAFEAATLSRIPLGTDATLFALEDL